MGSWLPKPVHPVPLTNVPGSVTNAPTNNNNNNKAKPKSPFYTGN